MLGLFSDVIHWCLYRLTLADVWSTGAGIKRLYYTSGALERTQINTTISKHPSGFRHFHLTIHAEYLYESDTIELKF